MFFLINEITLKYLETYCELICFESESEGLETRQITFLCYLNSAHLSEKAEYRILHQKKWNQQTIWVVLVVVGGGGCNIHLQLYDQSLCLLDSSNLQGQVEICSAQISLSCHQQPGGLFFFQNI